MTSRRNFLIKAATGGAAAILGAIPHIAAAEDAAPATAPAVPSTGTTREYWIQADSMLWNLVPNGRDDMTGGTYEARQSSLVTVGYRAYTPNWGAPLPASADIGENAGIPGPVIRARVGDTLVIHFKNNDRRPRAAAHSLHMEGLVRGVENDGFWHNGDPGLPGTALYPGDSYVYKYVVPANAAGTWMYYDYSASRRMRGWGFDVSIYRNVPVYTRARPQDPEELDASVGAQHGLFGMVVIEDERTKPVDRENIVIFHDLYSEEFSVLIQDFDCVNGRSFLSNTPTFRARIGERVRWRVGSLGRESHVFHIHGHRWPMNGVSTDTHILSPGTTATLEYTEDAAGTWLYHCHITEHMMGGMAGLYVVS